MKAEKLEQNEKQRLKIQPGTFASFKHDLALLSIDDFVICALCELEGVNKFKFNI